MDYMHRRYLRYFVEQMLIASLEEDLEQSGRKMLGEVMAAIAFADLVGFVQFTEERGEAEALDLIEEFVVAVEDSLPTGARVVKNIGDGVMIVGNDAFGLTDWAIDFQEALSSGRVRVSAFTTDVPYIATATITDAASTSRHAS
jgi:class 3 adenylate cyclase